MKRTPVTSKLIQSIGYDPDNLILEIEFRNGAVYDYVDVPQAEHAGLMNSASKGTYFNDHIREVYSFVRR